MSGYVIVDKDALNLPTLFGPNTVTAIDEKIISGSGKATINNKKICVKNDEKSVSINATYFSSSFPVPGTGKITIASLAADQVVDYATAETKIIVKGSSFTAQFTPQSPAKSPQGVPDPATGPISAVGSFINSQSFVTAK